MMATGRWLVVAMAFALTACAANGTRVTTESETYKSMARGQQTWCSQMGGCNCTLDGQRATCMLVQSCISTGSCRTAQ